MTNASNAQHFYDRALDEEERRKKNSLNGKIQKLRESNKKEKKRKNEMMTFVDGEKFPETQKAEPGPRQAGIIYNEKDGR